MIFINLQDLLHIICQEMYGDNPLVSFVLAVLASVVAHYICKWLDKK